jgi:hypothetical protein
MFSQIPIDFTVEQTANADAASSAKGRPICVIDIFMGQSFYNWTGEFMLQVLFILRNPF